MSFVDEALELPDGDSSDIEMLKLKLRAATAEASSAKQTAMRLHKQNEKLLLRLDEHAAICDQSLSHPAPIVLDDKPKQNEAVALISWGDWHVAEKVDKRKMHGRNQFNPEVCSNRVKKLTANTLKLLKMFRQHLKVQRCVLALVGDFITGYLHPELAETNCMGTMEEAKFAQDLLFGAVSQIAEGGGFDGIDAVCMRGNHGRTTKRIQFKNDYETSLESYIYWNLAEKINHGVRWSVPRSDIHYVELQPGYWLRLIHGHQIKFGGGVGGISIPLNKWIYRQDSTQQAIYTMLGHFHTYTPAGNFNISASLKGHDEYAMSLGFPFEPPSQSISLWDCRRKTITARYPIFCE